MRKHSDIPRNPFRRRIYYGEDSEIYMNTSGVAGSQLARIFAPSNEECRLMLLHLRKHQRWSQTALGAVLGISKATVRSWEEGVRNPCRAAKKLIWFVHALVFEPDQLMMGLEHVVTWGKAGSAETPLTLAGE